MYVCVSVYPVATVPHPAQRQLRAPRTPPRWGVGGNVGGLWLPHVVTP